MTTTTQTHGGGAQPASIDTSGKVTGGAALRVYGFDSEADAQAAGYVCEGGPAMSVALITDAQLASGAWRLEGDPSGTAVYTAPSNMPIEGGYAVPVYPVNGWGSAPAPVPPLFDSAEVGTVNASTVAVMFDQDVSASDYAAGVTIKVNGSGATISSATRQANHAIVYYVLSAAVVFGDTVTWEYVEASGDIVAEDDSTPLADVSAQNVTNNVAPALPAPLLDLEADMLVLNDGDLVSTWGDQSGNGYNFTQTGTARPTYHAGGGIPYVQFDGSNDWLLGPNAANDLASFTVFCVVNENIVGGGALFCKISNSANYTIGWYVSSHSGKAYISMGPGASDPYYEINHNDVVPLGTMVVYSMEKISGSEMHQRYNSAVPNDSISSFGTVTSISNIEPLRIGTDGQLADFNAMQISAIRIYSPAPDAGDRAAIEAELAARYGITL